MRTISIGLVAAVVLSLGHCKKSSDHDDSGLLFLLPGLTGTSAVTCANASYCATFVTTAIYGGNLGGITGADQKCTAAKPSTLTGTFKALITLSGTRTASPALDWVLYAGKEYRREDLARVIFQTDSNKVVTSMSNTIAAGANVPFWTGFDQAQWTLGGGNSNCSSWTSSAGGPTGGVGNTNTTTPTNTPDGAFSVSTYNCNNLMGLFCIQQ